MTLYINMETFTGSFKKDHPLFRTDARVKLGMAFIILIMVLNYTGFVFPLFLFSLGIILCILSRIPLKVFGSRFSEPLFIAAALIVIKFLFTGKQILFSTNLLGIPITGHLDGLWEGCLIASRIIGAVSIIAILGFTTAFTEIMAALSWFKIPKTFTELLTFTYRYLFVLHEDAEVIYSAQKNRLGYLTISRGLSSFGTMAGSLVLKAFEHSQNITIAMTQRGYDGHLPKQHHEPFKLGEIMASVLVIIALGWIWRI